MLSNDPIERWELFEDLLTGRLTDEQRRQVLEKMETDQKVADEIKLVRRAHQLLNEAFIEQQMRDVLRQIRAVNSPTPVFRVFPIRNWNRILAGVAAVTFMVFSYLTYSPIRLPDADNNVMVLRTMDTTLLTGEQRIAFENFFEGQARIVEGDYVRAAHHFETVLNVEDLRPYFKEATEWHLEVSYLRSRQINRANQMYERVQRCKDCTYEVSWLNRLKMSWQLFIAGWLP